MILKRTVKRKLIVRAMAIAFMAGAGSTAMVSTAYAQSNTTGTISGLVESPAGASILIEGKDGGNRRTVTPDASGRYTALSVQVGGYTVSLIRGGKVVKSIDTFLEINSTSDVSFTSAQRVEVSGRASRIDVSNTNSGTTFSAKELEKIPVASNVGAVIQLAPQTVKGDPRYGGNGAPSFGGASASENAYYINGFPVVNALTQVGFSSLPFGAISQIQILEGGYGAEYGRATGGVVNIATKRGTNEYVGALTLQSVPSQLRSSFKDTTYPKNGTASDGKIRTRNRDNDLSQWTATAELSGPIIKDTLFVYMTGEESQLRAHETRLVDSDPANSSVGWQHRKVDFPKYLMKVDWNITDNHHLEYTGIRDRPKDQRDFYPYSYASLSQTSDIKQGGVVYKNYNPSGNGISATNGADTDILKYTGYLTEDLTLSVNTGKSKTKREQIFDGYNPTAPLITVVSGFPGFTYDTAQNYNVNQLTPGAFSETKGTRVDLEYKLNDQHTFRLGGDSYKLTAKAGDTTPGGLEWRYDSNPCTQLAGGAPTQLPGPNAPNIPTNLLVPGAPTDTCYYAYSHFFSAVSKAETDQSAAYLEDRWQVSERLLLSLGGRIETFKNKNDAGQTFVEQKNQFEPRLGIALDLDGDGQTKIFGNAGRYHLQLPTNVAIRGAGASTFLDQYFSYTGVTPGTGVPTGAVAVGPLYSPDGELGQPKLISYVAATNLDSHYQDEFSAGIEKAFNKDLNAGVKFTYRKLKSTIEDLCDDRPFVTWGDARGLDSTYFESTWSCSSFNPGKTNTWKLDYDGDGTVETIKLTPQDLANGIGTFPKTKRTYFAIDTFTEHPFDGTWYGKVNYTYSKSKGNTEGQLNSDFGQADPGATLTDDHYELTVNSNGRLPNDREHVIKGYGFYSITKEWGAGANVYIASGRPKSCIGRYPVPNILGGQDYGSAYFFCGGLPAKRGSFGELPWQSTLDLNLVYTPEMVKGLTLKIDVFNVFNQQVGEQERDSSSVAARYHLVESYTPPRAVKFTAGYVYKF